MASRASKRCWSRSCFRAHQHEIVIHLTDEDTSVGSHERRFSITRVVKSTVTHLEEQTLLCIAHRVDTILGYDRVAVLDAGRVVEIGPPAALAADAESAFARIIAKKQQRSLL